MGGVWTAAAALVAVTGTILGVGLTQRSERARQVTEARQREAEWSRDRRLDAYSSMVRSVSLRVSALSGLRANIKGEGFNDAKLFADSAKSEMWIAVRRVRLVGPQEVATLAESLATHYSKIANGYPDPGGSDIEDEFGRAARAAIEVPGDGNRTTYDPASWLRRNAQLSASKLNPVSGLHSDAFGPF